MDIVVRLNVLLSLLPNAFHLCLVKWYAICFYVVSIVMFSSESLLIILVSFWRMFFSINVYLCTNGFGIIIMVLIFRRHVVHMERMVKL